MNFGEAITQLKLGKKLARKGWNGKGMFIYLTKGSVVQCDELKQETHKNLETFIDRSGFDCIKICPHIDMKSAQYNPYMAIKNVDGTISTWVASINDTLSEDWIVVE